MPGIILECPHCQDCHEVSELNSNVRDSISLNRATEEISLNEDLDWGEYCIIHGNSSVDCPSCEEVCQFTDLNPV